MTIRRDPDGTFVVCRSTWQDWLPWTRSWRVTDVAVDRELKAAVHLTLALAARVEHEAAHRRAEAARQELIALQVRLLNAFEHAVRQKAMAIARTLQRATWDPAMRRN